MEPDAPDEIVLKNNVFGVEVYAPAPVAHPVVRQQVIPAAVLEVGTKKFVFGDVPYAPAALRQAVSVVVPFGR